MPAAARPIIHPRKRQETQKLVGTFSPTLNGTVSSTPAPQPGHSMDYRRRFRRVRCRINAVTTRPFSLAKVCPETVHRA